MLSDFLLHSATNESADLKISRDDEVIELGAGTGITSICAGIVADQVVSTGICLKKLFEILKLLQINYINTFVDISKGNILNLIETNVKLNSQWIKGQVEVMELDFYNPNYSKNLATRLENSTLLIAADGNAFFFLISIIAEVVKFI